jgi:hypothetical protein
MSPKSRLATLVLRDGRIFVFSCMRIDGIGVTPRRLESSCALSGMDAAGLGHSVREAIEQSLPWVTREEFDRGIDDGVDPIGAALGLKERDIARALAKCGRITIADWPDDESYVVDRWAITGKAGRGISLPSDRPAVRKDADDPTLGVAILLDLQDSLAANLARKA